MLQTFKKHQKYALYALMGILVLGVGFSSYAQLSDNAYVVRTVHIFPSEMESQGWQNAETLNFQNLDEYALLQDFNSINSATLSENFQVAPDASVPMESDEVTITDDSQTVESIEESDATTATQLDTTNSSNQQPVQDATSTIDITDLSTSTEQPAVGQTTEAEPDVSDDQITASQDVSEESSDVSEAEAESDAASSPQPAQADAPTEDDQSPSESSTNGETGTTTVLRQVRSMFTLAIDTITETFSSTSQPTAQEPDAEDQETVDATTTSDQEISEDVTTQDDVTFGFVTDVVEEPDSAASTTVSTTLSSDSSAVDQIVEEEQSGQLATSTNNEPTQQDDTTGNVIVEEAVNQTATTSQSQDVTTDAATTSDAAISQTSGDDPDIAADCTTDCTGHVLRLSNFGYPLDEGVEISGAQLRVSFAAKHKQVRDTLPLFTMNYSFDGGATWSTGGSIVIDDEVSNSINGGYFLFALPAIDDSVSLKDLQVELRYDDDPALLADLFVESAWLELFVLEPPSDPVAPEFKTLLENDGFIDTKLSGDRLEVSDTEVIDFTFTDENSDESLIIKSSKKTYDGLSKTTTYFNVTNTSDQSDDFTVQTYFPQNMGEVTELSVFNLNKPRNTIIPEFRPYIYHCEAGWDLVDSSLVVPETLIDLSIGSVVSSSSDAEAFSTSSTSVSTSTQVVAESDGVNLAGSLTPNQEDVSENQQYGCGATSVVRSCDSLEGEGTACSINQKVRDHEVVQYSRGWESVTTQDGKMDQGGILRQAASFLGFGPDRKDIPESFEGRVYTEGTFSIAPGETRYFKMDISYPAFSSGEWWVEVIGDSEYGLLDPFWSSLWRYRKPITIDNTSGPELTEQQFFLELTSADSDFWTNVQSDGGDIRFVSETPGNDLTWWDTNWEKRVEITIPAASVDEDLTDFPVFVDLSTLGSDFFADVASDGRDIRMLDDAGVPSEYAYDLVAIDTGAETGELHFKATSLSSSTDNVFYLYFDNPSASAYAAGDTYGSQAVWTNNFDVRYALDDDPSSSGQQLDSTSNGNDATSYSGMTSGDVVTGQIGEAINHDGNDGATFGTSLPYAGEFTASMWWRSSGDGFAISRNAGATTKFGTWTGGSVFTRVVSASDTSLSAPADGTWTHVVLTRDSADKIDVYLDGVPTRLFGDGAQAGLSDWENMGGQTSQGFEGELDELRFASVKRSDGWVSTEFNNQSDPGTFYSTTSVESLVFSSFVELDHWVQHFDNTAQEADIWVQVDTIAAAASTTIQLYYGNATAESTSDEYAPFTYSTSTDLYYVVNDSQTTDIIVYSLIDNNEVSIDGGAPVTLQSGETTSFTPAQYASTSVISALGPITARTTDDASEPPVPISFATTTHITTTNRNDEDFYVYAPFATTDVRVFEGADVLESASSSVAVGTAATYNVNIGGGSAGIVESDEPILLYHNNDTDSYVAYPPTLRDLYGVHSNDYYYGSINGGASVEIYCSSGVSGTTTGMTRGGLEGGDDFCTEGANGSGPGVRLTNQTEPMGATQQADSDGNESTRFLPTPEFGTRYILPVGADYATIVCSPRFGSIDLEMQTAAGATLNTGTCTPSGESPGVLNFTAAYSQGTQVVSTNNVPFYVYYEEDGSGTADGDETNTWSAVQAKKYNSLYIPFTVGAEEVNTDAQYEQNNFRWYENTNGPTPSLPWPAADGATVTEGEAIADAGAVNPGDVMRLRMNLLANNGTGTVESTAFELQYAEAETCSAVVGTAWTAVAQTGSTTAAFTGFDNAAATDADVLASSLLSDSDVLGSYEEQNVSAFLPNQVNNGQTVEFDWVVEVVDPVVNTEYCFRMVRASTGNLASYAVYPQLLTAGPPEQSSLLTPFDNEHATSTLPNFTFVAADLGSDSLDYEIEIATDPDFTALSIVETADSGSDPFDFENITLASDKAPFNNGQVVRYLISNPLTNGQTYWWRVRAIDTNGSNTYGTYSEARSFTVNTAVTVSEWFQTTDAQFETNSLIGVRTSGSDSVELDISGSNLVGEYGTLEVTNGATTSVPFINSYTDPVVVTSIRYSRSVPNGDQPSPRVSNKSGSGFDVNANNFSFNAPGTSTIDWIVLEAGEWIIDDGNGGTLVFATSTSVSASDGNGIVADPGGPTITFPTAFGAPPAVFTTVTTINDLQWTFSSVYDGNNTNNPPTASQAGVWLNDSFADDGHGAAEDVDLIAFDRGNGLNNSVVFDVVYTANDVTDTPTTEPFAATFASTPAVILVGQLGNNGGTGSYGMIDLDNPPTASNVTISADEAGSTGGRGHTNEEMGIVAFQDAVGDIVRTGSGQLTSSVIDYDDVVVGNAWGEIRWNDSGDVTYRVQYQTGSGFQDIPDSALPGNNAGFTSSPINILDLDTETYNQLRLTAEFTGVSPEVIDWTVTWGQRVEIPELGDPYDNEKTADTTPTFDFTTTDPQGDALDYEISYSTDPTFESSSTTIRSDLDFTDFDSGTAGPYTSGETVTYTIPGGSALTDGETYWWRVRAKDPAGNDAFSPWSEPDNFTVDTTTSISTWFQTTQAQFQEGVVDGVVASTSDSVELSNQIAEYNTITLTDNDWVTVNTDLTYNNMVVVASPVYDYDDAIDNGRTPQVRNKTRTSFEIKVENATLSLSGSTEVHYMAIEAGDWIIEDGGTGTRIVAGTAEDVATTKGSNAGYTGGSVVDFVPDFSAPPAVFATVASNNDSKWVATVLDDGSQQGEVPATQMNVSLGVGYDTDTVRVPEDVDYVAVDVTTGDSNGVLFDSFNSPQSVTSNDVSVSFNQTFSVLPGMILTHNNATEGADGGFSQVDTSTAGDATQVNLSIAEIPANGGHAAEVVSVLAFESASGTILRDESVGGGLAGTIASEPVLFTDGLGPKFGQALIGATTPGASSVVVQFEYLTPGGDWELIPDVDLSSNSTGFSAATINMAGIDVGTYQTIRLLATLSCDGVDCPTLDDWAVEWSSGVDMTGRVFEYDRTTPLSGDSPFDSAWLDSLEITIQSANIDDDLTDFPVYVNLADLGDDFWAGVQSDGRDIRVTTVDGLTEVPFELVSINQGAQTGELYFKAPSLSDSTDTTFYIYFDNVTATAYAPSDPFGAENVWTNDFVAVYHDGGGVDSTEFGRTTTAQGGITAGSITGQMGGATDLNGSTQFFEATGATYLDGLDGFTTSFWMEADSIAADIPVYTFDSAAYDDGSDNFTGLRIDPVGADSGAVDAFKATVETNAPAASAGETNNNTATTNWSLLHHTWSGTTNQVADVYQDGSLLAWSAVPTALSGTLDADVIAIGRGNKDGYFDGTIDEFRVASTSRSAAWVAAEYANQSSATTFYATSTNSGGVTIAGDIRAAVNGVELGGSATIQPNGTWTFSGLTAFVGDVITVWVGGAPDAKEAVSVLKYDGLGDVTGVQLYERHLTLAADETATTTLADLAVGDNGAIGNEDVFFDVDGSGDLTVCGVGSCADANLYIAGANALDIGSGANNLEMHDFVNDGAAVLGNNTLTVGGSWDNNGVVSIGTSEVVFTSTEAVGAPWYDTDWSHRARLNIDSADINSTLTEFPVYVDLSDLDGTFFSTVRSDGGDIRITSDDGVTELAREIVAVDTSLSTGELHFKADSLSASADTTFYIYYGNATATDYAVDAVYGAENVWTNDFLAVYHDGGGFDSTEFGRTTTAQGGVTAGNINGQMGDATDLNGSTQFFEATGATYLDGLDGFTTSLWLESDTVSDHPLYSFDSASYGIGADDYTGLRFDTAGFLGGGTNVLKATVRNQASDFGAGETLDNTATIDWMLLHHTWSGTTNQVADLYQDGSLLTWDAAPAAVTGTLEADVIAIGRGNQTGYFDGIIDEFRIASTSRSAAWIAAEYENSFDSVGFYNPVISESYADFLVVGETLDDADGAVNFYDVTFGQSGDDGAWRPVVTLDVARNLTVSDGTLSRDGVPITVAGALATDIDGFWSGAGTTTFDGSGSAAWTDTNPASQNIGNAVIDGASRTVVIGSDVRANSILIGANDNLNAGGSNDIFISGDFINNNIFTPQSSQLVVDGMATDAFITMGGSNLYALRASTTGGTLGFTESAVTLLNDFSIAAGTVTLPTDVINVAGSFTNEGGIFAHNNGEVNFTSVGTKTISLLGSTFLNSLYDVRFSGAGNWTFLDTAATTTNTWTQTNGSVTLPSGTLTVGRNYSTTGSGSFDANGGEIVFLARSPDTVTTNGSEFYDVRIREGSPIRGGDFNAAWLYRDAITINAASIDDDLTDFPVYLDLADFGSDFFANINADGGDIRVTESDGLTEVPREIVEVDTGAETGEMYFKAPTLASTTNTTFYIYYGNAGASDYALDAALGAENVWDEDFLAVYHMSEDAPLDSTSFDRDTAYVGTSPTVVSGGQVGSAVQITDDGGNDYIDLQSDLAELNGGSEVTISGWVNLSDDTDDESLFTRELGNDEPILIWDNWSGSTNDDTYTFNVGGTGGSGNRVDAAPDGSAVGGTWQYFTAAMQGGNRYIYIDGALSNTNTGADTTIAVNTNGSAIGYWGVSAWDADGLFDEYRISSVERSAEWIAAEFANMDDTGSFYTVTSGVGAQTRTFADTDATIANDLVIESARAQFPTGNLFIGGSFDNNSEFTNSNGTVVFNATTTGHTVAASSSVFYDLTFDGVGGGWNIAENATATNDIELANGDDFTVDSGVTLESTGTFFTQLSNASTTWTGSTLLLSGPDHEINDKAADGDDFATLSVVGDTDISMWNATAATYDTQGTGSLYSQDHAGVDGDLYIFGDYERTTGTEYWNYVTDWDGTDLTGGSERQANVRIAGGARVAMTGSALEMLGVATASTTVDSQSGSYTWELSDADLAGEYFTATGGDSAGLQLLGSTTVSTFTNSEFTIPATSAAISLSSTTVDHNPAAQFFNIDFVSGGGSTNVDLLDTPASFWWFRDGVGDRYGEAFDNGDGNPGSVRWDDSNYQIDISGVVYESDQTTPLGGPTCDGSTANVRVIVDGGVYTDAVSCDGVTGAYNFTNVSYIGDPVVQVYLDTAGGSTGVAVTKTPISDIADMDIYANHTIVRHELSAPITIADLATYDSGDDSDIPYTAATNTPSLITNSDSALYVWPNKTFVTDGPITLSGNAGANSYDGTLELGAGATFSGTSTTYTLAGSLLAAAGASFDIASSTFVFNATTTGKVINGSSTIAFDEVQFTGTGGAWSVESDITASADLAITAGTLQGTGDITLLNGELTGNGAIDMTGGTVEIQRTNTFGGVTPWSFNNLTLGSGVIGGVTTRAGTATTTVRDTFTISAAHFYDAGSGVLNLAGNGTVFVETGTFLEATSTVQYSGATPTVLATPYYNLLIDDAVTTVAAVAPPVGLQVLQDLTIGVDGTASLNLTTNDPLTSVAGDLTIGGGGTLLASDSNTLQVLGDWTNNGVFNADGGTVAFNSPDTATITPGSSPFATALINGTGPYTVSANATATDQFTIAAATDYTQQSGTTLAVGGQFTNQTDGVLTTWTGTTLSLYGGQTYEINSKAQADDYEVIEVAANTHPRLWNSSIATATTATDGSLYVMDHDDISGELYIYGDFVNTSFDDHWSTNNDWDGAALAVPRQANVFIEGGRGVTYTGGGLTIFGTSTASTTIQNFGSGTYDLEIGGTADTSWQYAQLRDLSANGIEFTGTPAVGDFSFVDLLVEINSASAITVAGSAIDANPAKTFTNDYFNFDTGVTGAVNVTATGASVSSWRFTNGFGNIEGEAFDDDAGDPGEIVWEDSAQEITIAGNVYSDEGSTVSGVCDGVTNNVVVRVAGLTSYTGTCDGGTGAYSIPSVAFSANDTIIVYIDGETEQAANVSVDPVSNIANMDLYEDRVIVRHEGADPITIANMADWDSSDDADIPFTAIIGAPDSLTLPGNTKLIVWNSKTFEPQGDVTVGDSIELFTDGQFEAANGETHSVGASLIAGAGAVVTAAESEFVFTSTASGQTIDVNEAQLHTVSFTGAGAWTVTDPTFTVGDDVTISAGTLTLPAGTTTVAGSFNNTGGAFDANAGSLFFNAEDTGNTIAFGGSDANSVTFTTAGSWSFTDINATTTDSFTVASGTVTLPSGTLVVADDFVVEGTIAHNGGNLQMTGTTGSNQVTLNGNDLTDLTIAAPAGDYTLTDVSAALLGDLTMTDGAFTVGTGTVSVGGSFDVSGGTFNNGTGTLLFNSAVGGQFIDPGANDLHNVVISGAGGWNIVGNATTTNNFTLSNAGTFTLNSGSQLYVGGVFTNNVGGGATTWTGTTLVLDGGNEYETNTKLVNLESYENLVLGENTDVSSWRSTAASVTVPSTSSWYSQDHEAVDGALRIYGDYHIGTTTEYWSAGTDFDGIALGSDRAVTVSISGGSAVTVDGGSLQIIGTPAASTTIQNQGTGTYTFSATAGTLNANNYNFNNLDLDGLQLSGTISVSSLSNGYFTQAANGSNLITVVSDVIDNNASLVVTDTGFATGGFTGGANVTLDATTTNSWDFTGALGDFWGEDFDVDGFDACSSLRWDDSDCLLTEQTNYRWRNDDGGEGAPDSTWYDTDWSSRQRLRVFNEDAAAYTNTAVKVTVDYDADMQTDFEDLRFTDSDGVTLIPHWIERVTPSTDAIVWIQVPAMAADSINEVYMYYGNVVASDTSDGDAVFEVFESFDDNNISEYSGTPGDLALFSTNSTFAYGGGFGLDTDGNESGRTTNGITRTDVTVQQGQSVRFMQYIDTAAGSGDEVCTIFAANGAPSARTNYAVCVDQVGTDRVSIVEDVNDTENSGTVLGTANFTSLTTGWYEIDIDWETDNTIDVTVTEDSSGTVIATTTATDSTYTSGGIGFTYWFQNGGWDSFVAWPRTETVPTVFFGDEQTNGGATWAGNQNTPTGGFAFGDTARLRVSIENSGLPIVNQRFRLEYAPKLTAPSCEAVPVVNYDPVPNAATCGSDAVCMTTSANVSDGDSTTDHLVTEGGDFVAGAIVTDPNNRTNNYDLDQDRYTELEYAINLTVNATNDSYCFRVTDDGSSLDSYSNLPELTLAFDPVISNVTLNDGLDISLTPGTTTIITASSTVTDFNGVGDLTSATTTFYTTSAGAACTPDDNNCYVSTSSCSFTNCTATSCSLQCTAPFAYHATPTDAVGDPDEWFAFIEVSDSAGGVDFDTSIGVNLLTIRALSVQNDIAYGPVDINDDTGSFNPTVSLVNNGNEPIDVTIAGTDMSDGGASVIPAAQQLFATSTFTYSTCIGCQALSVIGTDVEVDLPKPTVSTPAVADEIYWGIAVPFGTNSVAHTGVNSFTAIAD